MNLQEENLEEITMNLHPVEDDPTTGGESGGEGDDPDKK